MTTTIILDLVKIALEIVTIALCVSAKTIISRMLKRIKTIV